MMTMTTIDTTLNDRAKTHGNFAHHSTITQLIKDAITCQPNWRILDPDQREALDMIAHKIGRILAGDPNHVDHWHDIAGYATLVEKRLKGESL